MAKEKYFWTKPNGKYGKDVRYGDLMPELDTVTKEAFLAKGWISTEKPAENFSDEKSKMLQRVQAANADLTAANETLKTKSKLLEAENDEIRQELTTLKNASAKADELTATNKELSEKIQVLEAELEDMPKNVREANKRIKELEAELDTVTSADSGKKKG